MYEQLTTAVLVAAEAKYHPETIHRERDQPFKLKAVDRCVYCGKSKQEVNVWMNKNELPADDWVRDYCRDHPYYWDRYPERILRRAPCSSGPKKKHQWTVVWENVRPKEERAV